MNKTPVTNRHGLNILVRYEQSKNPADKLAILQHGYSGSMETDLMQALKKTFLQNGYNVLQMDCTHSLNDADGELEENTFQTHYDDLEDVISWAKTQDWFVGPFALGGHSQGGGAVLHYAQNHPDDVSLLFPLAAITTGRNLEEAFKQNRAEQYEEIVKNGRAKVESDLEEGVFGYRPYSWFETMQDLDLLAHAGDLEMPCFLLVGANDEPTPTEHQQLLFNALTCEKEMHIIDGADHCYEPKLNEACAHLDRWLKKQAF